MEGPAPVDADVEAALRSTALSAMAALQQGIVHTEQKLQQCLTVLGSVQADVATYKHAHLASIQDAYRQELQQLTDAYEQQVRDLQERTQARVAQLQEATDNAIKQASDLLLQELQPGQMQPHHLQLEAPPSRQQQEQQLSAASLLGSSSSGVAAELSLAALQPCGSRMPGNSSSRTGSILDDVPLHPGTRSDCSPGSSGLWQQQQHKAGDQGGLAADTALHDQGSSLQPLQQQLTALRQQMLQDQQQQQQQQQHRLPHYDTTSRRSLEQHAEVASSVGEQPQSCIELLASLEALRASRRSSSSQKPDAAATSTTGVQPTSACSTPMSMRPQAFGTPQVSATSAAARLPRCHSSSTDDGEEVQQQRQAPSTWLANPCPPRAPRPQQHQPPITARRHGLRRCVSSEHTLRHARRDREELEVQLQAGLVRAATQAASNAPALASGCSWRRASEGVGGAAAAPKSLASSSDEDEGHGSQQRQGWRGLLATHETTAAAVRSTLSSRPAAAARVSSFRSSSLLDLL